VSAFTGELTITQLSGRDPGLWWLYRLENRLQFEVGGVGSGKVIVVPAGYVSDGASIKQILWGVLPALGRWSRAAILHDYLCTLLAIGCPHPLAPTRKAADDIFHEAMMASGVNRTVALILWIGVRAGDWIGVETAMARINLDLGWHPEPFE
jgi:hypothetical protein